MNAQIVKTYFDGSFDIITMDIDTARGYVKARTANADGMGIAKIAVRPDGATWLTWTKATGWTKECDNAAVEHPGFACAHAA